MEDTTEGMGARLRAVRLLHDLTQEELHLLAGVSKSLISKVEAGAKPGTWELAVAVGRALRVDPMALMGQANDADSDDPAEEVLPLLRRAAATYDDPAEPIAQDRPLRVLAGEVEQLNRLRLAANYSRLSAQLPTLLGELGRAVHDSDGDQQRRAYWLLAATWRCADAVAFKHGQLDLSAQLTDRMGWAAERSGDELMIATSTYVRGQTYLVTQAWDAGLRALTAAGTDLSRRTMSDARTAAVYGALHMRAAVVAARGQKADAAWSHMQIASAMADVVGRDVEYYYTSFGPSNARIHEMTVAVELGDQREALRRAGDWQPPVAVPAERASHWLLDRARAEVWDGRYREATVSLVDARARAPQHTRTNPLARQSVRQILRRGGRPTAELRAMAAWLGIAA